MQEPAPTYLTVFRGDAACEDKVQRQGQLASDLEDGQIGGSVCCVAQLLRATAGAAPPAGASHCCAVARGQLAPQDVREIVEVGGAQSQVADPTALSPCTHPLAMAATAGGVNWLCGYVEGGKACITGNRKGLASCVEMQSPASNRASKSLSHYAADTSDMLRHELQACLKLQCALMSAPYSRHSGYSYLGLQKHLYTAHPYLLVCNVKQQRGALRWSAAVFSSPPSLLSM